VEYASKRRTQTLTQIRGRGAGMTISLAKPALILMGMIGNAIIVSQAKRPMPILC
jgi:hypothetical protein